MTRFIYETFGQQFGDLILTGYGEEPDGGQRRLYLTELADGTETDWVIELVARHPPCRDEPLVLAALLKLLLSHPSISQHLEFEVAELLAELRWRDDSSTRRQVETAISSYVSLLYDKQVDAWAGRSTSLPSEGGYYHLLTGYVRGAKSVISGTLIRTSRSVYFDAGFIEGLKRGRIYFAGIDFGSFKSLARP